MYVGDGNNITHSWIRLAARFNFELVCACPEGFEPDQATVDLANGSNAGKVSISHDVYDVSFCSRTTLFHVQVLLVCTDGCMLLFQKAVMRISNGRFDLPGFMQAVKGADIVYTDVWASMGQKEEAQKRKDIFKTFQVKIGVYNTRD